MRLCQIMVSLSELVRCIHCFLQYMPYGRGGGKCHCDYNPELPASLTVNVFQVFITVRSMYIQSSSVGIATGLGLNCGQGPSYVQFWDPPSLYAANTWVSGSWKVQWPEHGGSRPEMSQCCQNRADSNETDLPRL